MEGHHEDDFGRILRLVDLHPHRRVAAGGKPDSRSLHDDRFLLKGPTWVCGRVGFQRPMSDPLGVGESRHALLAASMRFTEREPWEGAWHDWRERERLSPHYSHQTAAGGQPPFEQGIG